MKFYDWKESINPQELNEVIDILKDNGIVIFPTETVYGIGGNALSNEVADRIYEIKQRPRDKAINILVSSKEDIEKYANIRSNIEREIIEKYMPGPITLILEKKDDFGKSFTANNDTIGVRIPDSIIVQEILKRIDFPLIAPSANISGNPSGVEVSEIIKDFDGKVDAIIDGGRAKLALASTIVKVENEEIKILRQGSLTIEK